MKHICLLLVLAGCSGPPAVPPSCSIEKVLDIPVTGDHGFITVPALLDDKEATLIISTGSEVTMVTPTTMHRLGLHTDPQQRTTLTDIGGSITHQNAMLRSLKIGSIEMLNQSVAVGFLPTASSRGFTLDAPQSADGLLGADWLSGFDVELDLPHRRAALYRVHNCDGDYVPWLQPKINIHATLYGRGQVLLNATVDGHSFKAKLDSGTTASFIGSAAMAEAGMAAPSAKDLPGRAIGTDGDPLHTRSKRFDTLQIGPLRYANPLLAVADLRLRQSNLLLGIDWLQHNRVWISYAGHWVTIQPETPPAM